MAVQFIDNYDDAWFQMPGHGRKPINAGQFSSELKSILASATGTDYARAIACDDEFFSAVIQNVEETSAWCDEGFYTDDDIRLAVGRVLMDKLGIPY